MKYYNVIETQYGWAGVVMNCDKISRFILPVPDRANLVSMLQGIDEDDRPELGTIDLSVTDQISAYFSGIPVEFSLQIDYTGARDFDMNVWEAARTIQYGTTVAYIELADMIGNRDACRAVGRALGRNPVPVIVPCHRILRTDGTLGGFSAGLPWKKILLDIERKGILTTGDRT